jgi:hypothetical protein
LLLKQQSAASSFLRALTMPPALRKPVWSFVRPNLSYSAIHDGGTPLMQDQQSAGIDLPVKALAWADAEGKVWLSRHPRA